MLQPGETAGLPGHSGSINVGQGTGMGSVAMRVLGGPSSQAPAVSGASSLHPLAMGPLLQGGPGHQRGFGQGNVQIEPAALPPRPHAFPSSSS